MFRARWSWIVPLVGAALVFGAVLLTTPPGFGAIRDVILVAPSGPSADAAAYALGAAASLALVTLVVLSLACGGVDLLFRKLASQR
jgi:Mn2+/Fe2+ NRAMP family transporter